MNKHSKYLNLYKEFIYKPFWAPPSQTVINDIQAIIDAGENIKIAFITEYSTPCKENYSLWERFLRRYTMRYLKAGLIVLTNKRVIIFSPFLSFIELMKIYLLKKKLKWTKKYEFLLKNIEDVQLDYNQTKMAIITADSKIKFYWGISRSFYELLPPRLFPKEKISYFKRYILSKNFNKF